MFQGDIKKFHSHKTVKKILGHEIRKNSVREVWRLVWIMEKTPYNPSKELHVDLGQSGVTVSDYTLRHTLNHVGIHGQRPRRTPLLKERHKNARLMFIYRWKNEAHNTLPTVKYGRDSIMLWGCFETSGGIEQVKGMMKSEDFTFENNTQINFL